MTTTRQDGVLARLRRYQHLLIIGGGAAITALALAASLLEIAASVSSYLSRMKDEISIDARRSMEFSARATSTLRNSVQNLELAWAAAGPAAAGHVEKLLQAGLLRIQPSPDVPPLLTLSAPGADDAESAARYLRLAEQIAAPTAATSARNAGELTAYLYSPDRKFLVLSVIPWQGEAWQERIAADRERLFPALTLNDSKPLLAPDAAWRDPATGRPVFQWLAAYDSPLTGKRAVRVATGLTGRDGQPFGVLVFELPLSTLAETLPATTYRGPCLVLGPGGELVLSCQDTPDPAMLPLARSALAQGLGETAPTLFLGGHEWAAWPLGTTRWMLVFGQSWRDIAAGVRTQILASLLTAALIILTTWGLLLLVRWRVLAPAVAQSQRVFDSERLSRTLVETAPVGLGLIALDEGQSLLRSPTMADTAERVVVPPGQSLSTELSRHYRRLDGRVDADRPDAVVHKDLAFPTRDGERLDLSVSMARARYQGQDVLVTAFVDVTAKKRVEQQLRKARQAADSANAAKSAFLAAMSHEIRTPLNAILGNLELLSHSPLNAAQRDRLDTIRSASDGLLSVVSDVLDFSKIEAGELRLEEIEFDALEVASRALRMFAPMAQACGLALVGELGLAVSQPMRGDPTRLGQILHNLLSNAIKFTNAGKVTLRLALDEAGSQAAFEVEDTGIGMSAEQMARLFRAFSQGDATISRRFGGTGLGLALCSRLAQAMGGTMAAESEPGLGSRFTLRLPLGECAGERDLPRFDGQSVVLVAAFEAERAYVGQALSAWGLRPQGYGHPAQVGQRELEGAAALVLWGARQTWLAADENRLIEESAWVIDCAMSGPGLPTAAGRLLSVSMYGLGGLAGALRHALQGRALAPASPGRRVLARPLRILVAEDNLVNRRLFEEQLALLGCEVRTAEDGEAALAWLEREEYDVLLTDLAMPGMDGYALARRALRRWPSLPVVAATAHVTPQERERCAQAGMARVLGKPLSLEELGRTLSELTGIAWESPAATGSAEDLKDGQAILDALRQTFLQSCKASLETLRHAQAQGDTAQLLAELHSLGGALNVFRVHDVARDCSELDQAVRQTGIAANAAAIDRLCDALRQMEQHLPPGT